MNDFSSYLFTKYSNSLARMIGLAPTRHRQQSMLAGEIWRVLSLHYYKDCSLSIFISLFIKFKFNHQVLLEDHQHSYLYHIDILFAF